MRYRREHKRYGASGPGGFSDIMVYPDELPWEYAPKKPSERMDFLRGRAISREPYIWAQNVDEFDRYLSTVREMFFDLHTDQGLYRCDVRGVLESEYPVDTGVFSISIFPALYPGEHPECEDTDDEEARAWRREDMGISIALQPGMITFAIRPQKSCRFMTGSGRRRQPCVLFLWITMGARGTGP